MNLRRLARHCALCLGLLAPAAEGAPFTGVFYPVPRDAAAIPDFAALTPGHVLTVDRLDIADGPCDWTVFQQGRRLEHFGIVFEAQFQITRGGTHTFRLLTGDGARLIIDGDTVLEMGAASGIGVGTADLSAGAHTARVEYHRAECTRTALQLYWIPAGAEAEVLFPDPAPVIETVAEGDPVALLRQRAVADWMATLMAQPGRAIFDEDTTLRFLAERVRAVGDPCGEAVDVFEAILREARSGRAPSGAEYLAMATFAFGAAAETTSAEDGVQLVLALRRDPGAMRRWAQMVRDVKDTCHRAGWQTDFGILLLPRTLNRAFPIVTHYSLADGRIEAHFNPATGEMRGKWSAAGSDRPCAIPFRGTPHWGSFRVRFDETRAAFEGTWGHCRDDASHPWSGTAPVN